MLIMMSSINAFMDVQFGLHKVGWNWEMRHAVGVE